MALQPDVGRCTPNIDSKINPCGVADGDEQCTLVDADVNASYGKTWGKSVGISMPVVGNHDYGTAKPTGNSPPCQPANRGAGKGYYSETSEHGTWWR